MITKTLKLTNPSFAQVAAGLKIFAVLPKGLGIDAESIVRFHLHDKATNTIKNSHVDVRIIYLGPTEEIIVPDELDFMQFILIGSSVSI